MVHKKIQKTNKIKKNKKINSSKSFNDVKSKLKNKNYKKTKKHHGGWNLFGIGNKDILQCYKCSLPELISKTTKFIGSSNINPDTYYREYYNKSDLKKYKSYRLFNITSDFFSIEGIQSNIDPANYPELLFIKETYKGKTSTTVKIGYFLHLTEISEIPEISQNNSKQKIIIRRFFKPFKEYNFKVLRKYYTDKDQKKPYYIIENFDYERNLELVAEFNQKSNEDNLKEEKLKTFSQTLIKNYLSFPDFISLFNYLQIFEKLESINNSSNTNTPINNSLKGYRLSINNLIRNSYKKTIDLKDYYLFIYQKYNNGLSVRSDFFKYFLVGIIEKFGFYYNTDDNKKYMKIKTKLNPIRTEPYAKIDINKNKNKRYDIFIYNFTINNNKSETKQETEPPKNETETKPENKIEFILDHYNKCMIIVHSASSKCKDVNFTSSTDTCYLFNKLIQPPVHSHEHSGNFYYRDSNRLSQIKPYASLNEAVQKVEYSDEEEYNLATKPLNSRYSLAAPSSPEYSLAAQLKPDYA